MPELGPMPRSRRSYASLALLAAILIRAAGPALAESPWHVASAAGAALRLDASRSTTFSNELASRDVAKVADQ